MNSSPSKGGSSSSSGSRKQDRGNKNKDKNKDDKQFAKSILKKNAGASSTPQPVIIKRQSTEQQQNTAPTINIKKRENVPLSPPPPSTTSTSTTSPSLNDHQSVHTPTTHVQHHHHPSISPTHHHHHQQPQTQYVSSSPIKSNTQSLQQQQQQQQDEVSVLNPNSSIKLISKSLNMKIDSILKLLTKDDNFMVVGVIGGQSGGKSTILSSLVSSTSNSSITPFEIQTEANFCLGNHQTEGIDVYITSERIIYLDTQPLQSISIVSEMIEKNQPYSNNYTSHEHLHFIQSLKIIIFLLSVCNIVLVVQEGKTLDISICNLIKTALMLKNRVPDISSTTDQNDTPEYISKLMFVFNKLTEIDYETNSLSQPLSKILYKIGDSQPIDSLDIPDKFICAQIENSHHIENTNNQDNPIPAITPFPNYNESIGQLKKRLLTQRPSTKFLRPIGERDWLENANRIWEFIQDYDYIETYNKVLQTKRYR